MAMMIQRRLDLQGVPWRLTLRRVANAVRELSPGELIEVLATDPELVRELDAWSRATGDAVLESSQFGNVSVSSPQAVASAEARRRPFPYTHSDLRPCADVTSASVRVVAGVR